ncbi:MAG TPA: type 1 glutamine amidotransferase domain-containing protein [Beijerinckia sp.]|jgi:protease I|nr:type 1 glutamine amidotransferase domain-containing protein [Beijerinckia sp.]
MPKISEARILIMATDGFEQAELLVPLKKLREAGALVRVAAPKAPEITGWDKNDWGEKVPVDVEIISVDPKDYDCVVLPGGQMNPDALRTNDDAIDLILDFLDSGKLVAAICHAPWLLVEAAAVEGRKLTSWSSIKTDIENAGGEWIDRNVVVDDNLITGRSQKDLDAFVSTIIEQIEARPQWDGEFRQSA